MTNSFKRFLGHFICPSVMIHFRNRFQEEGRIEIKDLKQCLIRDSKSADDTIERNMILLISDF